MYALAEEIVGGIPDKYFFDASKSGDQDEPTNNATAEADDET